MDARELTKKYQTLSNEFFEKKKQIEYLTEEVQKLRMLVDDLKIDVAMINHGKR